MGSFISWIKMPDGRIFYLTDEDVYSTYGKLKLKGSRHNDPLGHSAIRAYYDIPGDVGVDCEERDFWNATTLPAELAERIKHFDRYWGKMWKEALQPDDLLYIASHGSERWKRRVALRFMHRDYHLGYFRDAIVVLRPGIRKLIFNIVYHIQVFRQYHCWSI